MTSQQALRDVVVGALRDVAPEIDADAIDPDADLGEEFDIDSMDLLNIVVAIHKRTGIEIPERDYPKLATLNEAVAYLVEAEHPAADS